MPVNGEVKNFDPTSGKTRNDAALKNDFAGNREVKEFHIDPDNDAPKGRVGKGVMAVMAGSLAALLLLGGAGNSGAESNAKIASTWVSESEIGYHIVVPAGEDGLTVSIYNNYLHYERALSAGDNEGIAEGLAAGGTYTV